MRVTLLRHAQTEGNLLGRYIGSSDVPICEDGRRLAECIPPRTDTAYVYTSSLRRTVQTALILYPNAKITACGGFDEMDFGRFEQKSWQEMEQDAAYRAWVDSGCRAACPGGENKADFTKRCIETFLFVAGRESAAGSAELHCVIHGGVIMAVLSELAQPVCPYFDWRAGYCGGYLLEYRHAQAGGRPLQMIKAIRPKKGDGVI